MQGALNKLGTIVRIVEFFEFCYISAFSEPLPIHQQPDLSFGLDDCLQGFFVEFENAAIEVSSRSAVNAAAF